MTLIEQAQSEDEKIISYALNPKNVHLYVVELLPEKKILYRFANDAFRYRTHKGLPEEIVGSIYNDFHTSEESENFYKQLAGVIESGQAIEFETISRHGRITIKSLTPFADDETGKKFVTVVTSNIRDLKETQEKLEYEALHDSLTGLGNRRLLKDRVKMAKANLNREHYNNNNENLVSILKMDLDNFKINNDSYGHQLGDKLLILVAKRLNSCTRDTDTVVREGGDEFCVVLPKITEIGVATLAKKIIYEIGKPYNIDDENYYLGISIGISFYPKDGEAFKIIYDKADQALYHAKNSGRNTYRVFNESNKR